MAAGGALSKYWMFSDAYTQNPFPTFAALRAEQPVAMVETPDGARAWVVTRYEDVRNALADPRMSRDIGNLYQALGRQIGKELKPADEITHHLANSDPPRHTRLRKALVFAFTPKRVANMRPSLEKVVDELLDELAGQPQPDLLAGLTEPLPIIAIAQLLGVPASDWRQFKVWSNTMRSTDAADPTGVLAEHTRQLSAYMTDLIAEKERHPTDDLVSAMVHAEGDRLLTPKEILSTAFALMTGGNETTTALVTGCFVGLLTHPEQAGRLKADPDRIPQAVDELIRFAGPMMYTLQRLTLEDVEIAGTTIPAGEIVMLSPASANHDPEAFPDRPDELDIDRPKPVHLTFGHGIHYCIGTHLARAQAEISIRRVFERFPDARLAVHPSELRYQPALLVRSPAALPVRL
ncbi:cytochrome P450 family protein [Streptomyces cyslabdanicus]|uniref:cytochrome P450 family protein n=1 Tax=Streptomyces cyslabdanicus TaxID=1470456 RepID=UPI0040449037